jgi:hypothetical protein
VSRRGVKIKIVHNNFIRVLAVIFTIIIFVIAYSLGGCDEQSERHPSHVRPHTETPALTETYG